MSRDSLAQRLPRLWFRRPLAPELLPLLPLSWLFAGLTALRRGLYRHGILSTVTLPVPVVVVGNLTVGGSGKTPLVLWLARALCERGWRPGIISRGYGGRADGGREVSADAPAALVGDEPLLLARRSRVPVFVGPDRAATGAALLAAHPECNVLIADDGLQHYRLARRAEIAVFDARGAGNAHLLPAGPLREPLTRLASVTAVVWNLGVGDTRALAHAAESQESAAAARPGFLMRLHGERFVALRDAQRACSADELRGRRLHAVAGIGDPSRFFAQVSALGLQFTAHAFPDHHVYEVGDLAFGDDAVLLMTEKDAVKCAHLNLPEAWVLPVDARIARVDNAPDGLSLLDTLLEKLNGCTPA